jgi:simple sugar transport system substrate-binding protein
MEEYPMRKNVMTFALLAMAFVMVLSACGQAATTAAPATQAPATQAPATQAPATATQPPAPTATPQPFVFGMLLVGAKNDNGWSQATFEGGQYVEQQIPGSKMLYLENVYSGSPSYPGQTASQLATQLVSQGAKLIFFNSDDMKDEALKFAQANPKIYVIGVSDDWTWKDGKNYQDSANQVDIMGRMEYMKEIAGCAAALTTQTGKIGFLGPLINDETRRLASSAFLGAQYCWTKVLNNDPTKLTFTVNWIGFWFNIPGVTSDPTQVADNFYNTGYDVVISGIDTTENLVEAEKAHQAGKSVWGLGYDYKSNCSAAPDICLGVPYFNWGPAFAATVKTAIDGSWKENFQWNPPDWTNINNPDTGAVGFTKGAGLSADNSTKLDAFIAQLAGGLNLWNGPLNLQDKTVYLADGVAATDQQIWYLPQLLDGMQGSSVAK